MAIPDDRGDESFADDLNMWPGIVSGRVALLLRSTEIQPAAAPICPLFAFDRGVRRAVCGERTQAPHPGGRGHSLAHAHAFGFVPSLAFSRGVRHVATCLPLLLFPRFLGRCGV